MRFVVMPSSAEIEEQYQQASGNIEEGFTIDPSLTYEEGVADTIDWLFGTEALPPITAPHLNRNAPNILHGDDDATEG